MATSNSAQSVTSPAGDPLLLSLRAWSKKDPQANSLNSLATRIFQQRGSLRDVTEDSLKEEIESSALGEVNLIQDTIENATLGPDGVQKDASKDRKEEVLLARNEMIQHIDRARIEAHMALDYVSLLLSKSTPVQAEISMTPGLRQLVPLGSLAANKAKISPPSQADREDRQATCRGWKLQSLESSADSLLKAATRLEKEIEGETKYWEQVLAVKEKGWSVCRLPGEKHTLGVRYGFSEARASYRDRSLAALRRDNAGDIYLDQGAVTKGPKAVSVRIQDSSRNITSCSSLRFPSTADTSIEELILRARDIIFEEELFHELNREARLLASQGVQIIDSTIQLELQASSRILIDIVPLDSESTANEYANTAKGEEAEIIALMLRILLSYAHRQNLHRRSQPPPPLTVRQRPTPSYTILRPIVTHILHISVVHQLRTFLTTLAAAMNAAGLEAHHTFTFTVTKNLNTSTPAPSISHTKPKAKKSVSESVVETFTDSAESSIDLHLPSGVAVLVKLRTKLALPVNSTEFLVSTTTARGPATLPRTKHFSCCNEMLAYLQHLVTLSILSEMESWGGASASAAGAAAGEGRDEDEGEKGWVRASQVNELQKGFGGGGEEGKMKRVRVKVAGGRVGLKWAWVGGKGTVEDAYTWSGVGAGEESKTLREMMRKIGSQGP